VPRVFLAGGLGLAASFLVACGGGSGLLSSNQANSLNTQLDQISNAVSAGNCSGASSAINAFSNEVGGLSGVNSTLQSNLAQDAQKVADLVTKDCHTTVATPPATTANTTPTNTTSTATAPTSTPTTPSTSTPSTSTPATPPTGTGTTPSGAGSGGAGLGNGNGNGGGASGGAGAGNGNGQ
jgi:hypothetical protein